MPNVRVFVEVIGSTPDEYTRFVKADLARWKKVLNEAGIKPE